MLILVNVIPAKLDLLLLRISVISLVMKLRLHIKHRLLLRSA